MVLILLDMQVRAVIMEFNYISKVKVSWILEFIKHIKYIKL